MIIEQNNPNLISEFGFGIEVYSVSKEAPHYQANALEILVCLSGKVCCTISHRVIELVPGDFVAINANEVHYCSAEEDNLIVSFYFDHDSEIVISRGIKNLYIDNIWGNNEESLIKKRKHINLQLMSLLHHYINQKMQEEAETCQRLIVEILDILAENFQLFYISNQSTPHAYESKERFDRIISFLKANYNRKITIDEISSTEHISSNYLSQYVKKSTMMGITKILTFIRTHESERLLLTEDLSIINVAYDCGFSDPKLYYKAFRQYYGHTPNQHKQIYRELVDDAECKTPYKINNTDNASILEHYILANIAKNI